MNHPQFPALRPSRRKPSHAFLPLLIPAAGLALACSSCSGPEPQPDLPILADTTPVGEGLKVIGYAVVAFGVLGVLGRMLK
jgi:hypothetical protein